jgi:hypothetical protein
MPDSPFASKVPDEASIRQVQPANWQAAYNSLNDTQKAAIDTFNQSLPEDQQITFDFSNEKLCRDSSKDGQRIENRQGLFGYDRHRAWLERHLHYHCHAFDLCIL